MCNLESIIGISDSVFTAMASLPQLLKIVKEKKADDISAIMLLVLLTGLGLWVLYGFLKKDWILIIANSFSFLLNLVISILKVVYKK